MGKPIAKLICILNPRKGQPTPANMLTLEVSQGDPDDWFRREARIYVAIGMAGRMAGLIAPDRVHVKCPTEETLDVRAGWALEHLVTVPEEQWKSRDRLQDLIHAAMAKGEEIGMSLQSYSKKRAIGPALQARIRLTTETPFLEKLSDDEYSEYSEYSESDSDSRISSDTGSGRSSRSDGGHVSRSNSVRK